MELKEIYKSKLALIPTSGPDKLSYSQRLSGNIISNSCVSSMCLVTLEMLEDVRILEIIKKR